MPLMTFYQAVEYVGIAGSTQAPVFVRGVLPAQQIRPGGPAPILSEAASESKKSRHGYLLLSDTDTIVHCIATQHRS